MPFDNLPELDKVELALRAARRWVESGWTKYELHDYAHEKHCVVGAIKLACAGDKNKLFHDTIARFYDTLPPQKVPPGYHYQKLPRRLSIMAITIWNDRKSRTKSQVLKQFDKVLTPTYVE